MGSLDVRGKLEKAKPVIFKGVCGGLQGYVFGCVVGLFTNKRCTDMRTISSDLHSVGKKFALVGGIYSATEGLLEETHGRRPINSVVSSAISGMLAQRKSGARSMVTTATLFTLYNTTYQIYGLR